MPRVLEGLGSSGKLVGIISTCPGTFPTPWCRVMTKNTGRELLVRHNRALHKAIESYIWLYRITLSEVVSPSFSPLGAGSGTRVTSSYDSSNRMNRLRKKIKNIF